jgi:putative ABC transport system permease protein
MAWWKFLPRKRDREAQLESELQFHVEALTRENMAAGLAPEEARRRALLAFGGPEQLKEEMRDVYRIPVIESIASALKYALRFARKSPSLSLTVVLTLALGIGANTAVFSAIDTILLRPLPFPNSDRLMQLAQVDPKKKGPDRPIAPIRLEDWNRLNSTFQAIAGYYTEDVSETSGSLPEKASRAWVSRRFFQVWGVSPVLGRGFVPEEELMNGPKAVVITDRFWRRRFGADPNALGKRLRLEGYSYTIVGIMPASFFFPDSDVDLWCPEPVDFPLTQNRQLTWYTGVGRLKPGATVEQARADLSTVQAQLSKQFPATDTEIAAKIEPLKEVKIGGIRRSLWVLFGSVTLLLLIACSNIASLLVAHTAKRSREIAIRFSLGASRAAVTGQLLAEAFVLALAGSLLALLIAAGSSSAFHKLAANLPRAEEVRLDWRILLYTLVCAVGVTLLCGLLPALRATSRGVPGSLAQASRALVSARNRLQWTLAGVQVALAVTLLVAAGLLLRSFLALARVAPGFELSHILTLRISGNYGETVDMKALTQRIDRTLEAMRSLPGVEGAATSASFPGIAFELPTEVKVSGQPVESDRKIVAEPRFVSAGYFETMRIPLLSGETCRASLNPDTVVVNRSFADTYLSGSPVVGQYVEFSRRNLYTPPRAEIKGIVGDAREQGLTREPAPTVYWCYSAPDPSPVYLVRTHDRPMAMAETLRRKIHEVEPARSMFDVAPLAGRLDETFTENRLRTILLTFFAVTAVSLTCVGLYGTLSYSVSLRRREVGLRLAMGAMRGQIVGQFLLYGLRACLAGCAAGLCLAAGFARVLSGMLFGIAPWDPTAFAGTLALAISTACLSLLLPAIRAARLDPMEILREE